MDDKDFESLLEMCSACKSEAGSDGIEMLMANLAKIHEYSGEMMSLLSREMDVEDWIEDKISKAAQSLSDAKHYIEYKGSAYASQAHAIEAHGGDVGMAQVMSVSGAPRMGEPRVQGERMPIMSQMPEMTPQSSMQGGGCGSDLGSGMGYGDDYGSEYSSEYEDDYGDEEDYDGDEELMIAVGLEELSARIK